MIVVWGTILFLELEGGGRTSRNKWWNGRFNNFSNNTPLLSFNKDNTDKFPHDSIIGGKENLTVRLVMTDKGNAIGSNLRDKDIGRAANKGIQRTVRRKERGCLTRTSFDFRRRNFFHPCSRCPRTSIELGDVECRKTIVPN